ITIMPLGDSITGSPGCWRSLLWNELVANAYDDVDFVGSLKSVPCGDDFDGDHEGHRGVRAIDAANKAMFTASFRTNRPDIVMMHFGTNDIWHGDPRANSILNAYSTLLEQLRAANPKVTLLVSQLIPMNPKDCVDCMDNVAALNTRIPDWVRQHGTKQSPVIAVDQWAGFDVAGDTRDGVHPNGSGTKKLAANWMAALRPVLDNR
ncbi:MAG: SGNH/GDSL hydrolase family protein, partial [Stackebrandtia sp.]